MTDLPLWAFILAVPLGFVLAIPAHELTHFVTIWPVAHSVEIRRTTRAKLQVVYELYNDPWRLRWADISDLSPTIVGFVLLIVMVWAGVELSLETLWIVPTWLRYTIGGAEDYASLLAY